jgi:[ribosomal protein S18]-alanine N-acetyltransferase
MQRYSGNLRRRGYADFVDKENLLRIESVRADQIPYLEAILEQSPEAGAWSAKALAEIISSHNSHFFSAWRGEDIVGFIAGRGVGNEAEILNLAVLPQFRQRGVGKSLVQQLLQMFAGQGVSEVFLEVRQSNAAAVAFYRSVGFRQVGERPGYYRNPPESALILALELMASGSTAGTA